MIRRSSLKWPIILGTTLFVLTAALLVFWIIWGVATKYWAFLIVGVVFIALILIGVTLYLILSIKEVRLTQRQANFIDAVTHELKSPIASLKLYLQTMDMWEVDPDQQREFHRFMLEDVQRLDGLIDDLLEAAKLDHRQREESTEDIDPVALLRTCLDALQRRYDFGPEAIQISSVPCVIRGRPHDLEMILVNLLDNAAKYGGDPRQLLVQVLSRNKGRVLLRISDNGAGVPSDMRRKIFNRFVRGGSELERRTKGTGLGLFLVRELVARMKGRIAVIGRGPLGGATFELDLPGRPFDPVAAVKSDPAEPITENP
jgi:two-component system phosphate regulon sensor histidine kinase PhoR